MYFHLLDEEERRGFRVLGRHLLFSDGRGSDAKSEALDLLLGRLESDGRTRDEETSLEEARSLIQTHRSKIISLIELTGLAFVDSDFCQEQDFLRELAGFWGISEIILDQIIQDVAILANLDQELLLLMEEEEE